MVVAKHDREIEEKINKEKEEIAKAKKAAEDARKLNVFFSIPLFRTF